MPNLLGTVLKTITNPRGKLTDFLKARQTARLSREINKPIRQTLADLGDVYASDPVKAISVVPKATSAFSPKATGVGLKKLIVPAAATAGATGLGALGYKGYKAMDASEQAAKSLPETLRKQVATTVGEKMQPLRETGEAAKGLLSNIQAGWEAAKPYAGAAAAGGLLYWLLKKNRQSESVDE